MSQADAILLERLRAIRADVRRRLVWYGVCAVLSGGLLSFTTIVLLDWLLWLPPMLRVVVGILFFVGFVWAAWHWIARPLRARLSLNAVAGKLEDHFPRLGDSLTSAISFLEAQAGGSEAMMRRVIDSTGRTVGAVPLESALTLRPLVARAAMLGGGIVLAGVIIWLSPGWYGTGLTRYARPFGDTEWPRKVQIIPDGGDANVALGDALTVKMRIGRGMSPDLRGVVKVRDPGGALSSFAMQREGDADFYFTLDGIGSDLTCWFEAGDDSTADRPFRVAAVKRPVIVEAAARVDAPHYAQPREPVELDLSTGTLRAVAGSQLTLAVRSSKPVGRDAEGNASARVDFEDGRQWPLAALDGDATRLGASVQVDQGGAFQIVLRDADGFENQGRRDYQLIVDPDQVPVVTVTEPAALTEVTPTGSVMVAVRAEDDFGVESIGLTGELLEGGRLVSVPIYSRENAAASAPAPSGEDGRMDERAVREVRHTWEIGPLGLRAGDVLTYRAEAADNLPVGGDAGQKGSSPALRLKVIGADELEARLRDEFAALEKRVRQSMAEQEALRDETRALAQAAEGDAELTSAQTDQARRSGQQQHRLAQRVADAAERFARTGERMRLNQVFDEETRSQVVDMTGRLRRTASATMNEAARALDATESLEDGKQQRAQVALAEGRQAAAIDEMQDVIRWMGRWGDFQEVVARTRDLLDRQQEVRAATLRQGVETVGAAMEALSDAQKAALRANMRDQEQLSREMEQWLRNAVAVKESVAAKDPAAAEAVDQAVRLAGAQQVLQRMENAAEAVGTNRTAGAALEQRAAEAGLASVLAALEARQARELAELKKSVERLVDGVRALLQQQEGLLAANEEAAHMTAGAEVFERLAGEQRSLRRNTEQLGDEAEGQAATNSVGKQLKKAAVPMESAEKRMQPASSAEAAADQREAETLLKEVVEELEKLAAQTEHRLMQTSMAVTRRKLEEIRGEQEEVNGPSAELVDVLRSQGRLDRAGARRASKLSARQTEIQGSVDELAREMEKAVVYGWVLEQVSGGMKSSSESLAARKLDDAMTEGQREIVAQLRRLIEALASIEGLPPPDKFAEGQGGDGGEAAIGEQPPVPPVAELIVLKAMQESLRDRTGVAQKAWGEGEPSEADLRRAKKLGEEQERLREMTEQVTRQAREGD